MGGGFSCTAKGSIKAGDKFETSGEIQMEAKAKVNQDKKEEKEVDSDE